MVARSFDTPVRGVQGVRRGSGAGLRADQDEATEDLRYRLDVVAADVADVVRFAGGWLFDRAMAGWDVTVLLADRPDDRPLQILGVQILDLEDALAGIQSRARPQALAAAADLFGCDSRVRQGVLQALDHGVTEVTLWGETWPVELNDSVGLVQHRLSMAAQMFKAQALAAAAISDHAVGHTEVFRSGLLAWPSIAADLVPAG